MINLGSDYRSRLKTNVPETNNVKKPNRMEFLDPEDKGGDVYVRLPYFSPGPICAA